MSEWKPIETAPKTGVSVVAFTRTKHGNQVEAMYFADGVWHWSFDGDCPDHQPSHWMELPPPPTN